MIPIAATGLVLQLFTVNYGATRGAAQDAAERIHDIVYGVRSDLSPAVKQMATLVSGLQAQAPRPSSK